MQELKQKIKDTTLFTDEDKIAILAAVDGYDESDRVALNKIIDDFDRAVQSAIVEYKKSIHDTLSSVVAKAKPEEKKRFEKAASNIKSGVDMLLQ